MINKFTIHLKYFTDLKLHWAHINNLLLFKKYNTRILKEIIKEN